MIALALALAAASDGAARPGFVDAVEACTRAALPKSLDLAPIAAAGFVEAPIKDIDKAKGDDASIRMFIRDGAGAVIMVKTAAKTGSTYCHVLTHGTSKQIDLVELTLVPLLGERIPLGSAMTFFKSDKQPWIASLTRKPDGKAITGDIMIMGFDPKEVRAK
jgi:hypothetical protein